VVFELIKQRSWRDNIWVQIRNTDVFRRIGAPGVEIDLDSPVAGWDDHELYIQRIRNYTRKPIEVEIRRSFPGHVIFKSRLAPTLFDYQTVQFGTTLASGKKQDLPFEILRHQGRNAHQSNVTLEAADAAAPPR
jgi:hypothetical protein